MKLFYLYFMAFTIYSTPSFSQGYEYIRDNGKYGIKNKASGKVIIEPKYSGITSIGDSIFAVQAWGSDYSIVDCKSRAN